MMHIRCCCRHNLLMYRMLTIARLKLAKNRQAFFACVFLQVLSGGNANIRQAQAAEAHAAQLQMGIW